MSEQHQHDHSHHHHVSAEHINMAFIAGIVLNLLFVIVEFGIGYYQSSLGLISDAGHNLTDVFSLLLALFAFRMMRVKASEKYSYGYKKTGILVSLFNAICLVVAVGLIIYEGFARLNHTHIIDGFVVSLVALCGIFINGISAFLFMKGKDRDINVRGAYLHLLADAMVSAAVMIAGIIMYYTGWYWIDVLISTIVAVVILRSGWKLLSDSVRLALDGTPPDVNVKKVKETILSFDQVINVDHIHIWALSSSQNALTAHIAVKDNNPETFAAVKHQIRHALEHLNIHHVTLELELKGQESSCGDHC